MSLSKSQHRVIINDLPQGGVFQPGSQVELSPAESHRIRKVVRKKEGDEVSLISPADASAYQAIICCLHPAVVVKIIREEVGSGFRGKVGMLACALIKGERIEWICQKACELGVRRLIFWGADHSVVKFHHSSIESKRKRLCKIIEAAVRQSANLIPPMVDFAPSCAALISSVTDQSNSGTRTLYCSTSADAAEIREVLDAGVLTNVIVGPEGDFSTAEERSFREAGWQPVSLGPLVLRAETAALSAVVAVNTICGFTRGE